MFDENIKKANKTKADTIIKALEKRGMKGYYCDTREEALELALSFINEGDKVACGGSMTLGEIGLKDRLGNMNIDWVDPFKFTDADEMFAERVRTLTTDVYFMSSNAVTMDGILVNIDGTGNRVAALCYGPKKVVLVVGANKIVGSEEDAVARIKTDACPPNCERLGKKTPCAATGKCGNCLSQGNTICSYTVSTRFCSTGRLHVILVNDYLGY